MRLLGANLHCLLPGVLEPATSLRRLLPGGRTQNYTTNIFLHQLWSMTSSNVLCGLEHMEPSVPWVSARYTPLTECVQFSSITATISMFFLNVFHDLMHTNSSNPTCIQLLCFVWNPSQNEHGDLGEGLGTCKGFKPQRDWVTWGLKPGLLEAHFAPFEGSANLGTG